jgi:hypothetical protein
MKRLEERLEEEELPSSILTYLLVITVSKQVISIEQSKTAILFGGIFVSN